MKNNNIVRIVMSTAHNTSSVFTFTLVLFFLIITIVNNVNDCVHGFMLQNNHYHHHSITITNPSCIQPHDRCTTLTATLNRNPQQEHPTNLPLVSNYTHNVQNRIKTPKELLHLNQRQFHLISLPSLSDTSPKIIRELWKWKDVVLGDGRDYFVPRPRALKALSDILVGSSCRTKVACRTNNMDGDFWNVDLMFTIQECAILSNCARLDILVLLQPSIMSINYSSNSTTSSSEELPSASRFLIASLLIKQLESYSSIKSKRGINAAFIDGISSFLDLPGMVADTPKVLNQTCCIKENDKLMTDLYTTLQQTSNLEDICRHFNIVAAGMPLLRPSRPDRPIPFRPFSSRDAHIMLQLKRTTEVASKYPNMKIILDSALSAGKWARDPTKVPILEQMKRYDGEGKYSMSAPPELARQAVDDVMRFAIEPSIARCVSRINALNVSEQIQSLRNDADDILFEITGERLEMGGDASKVLKRLLHTPLVDLREGIKVVDKTQTLNQIRKDLQTWVSDTSLQEKQK